MHLKGNRSIYCGDAQLRDPRKHTNLAAEPATNETEGSSFSHYFSLALGKAGGMKVPGGQLLATYCVERLAMRSICRV